MVPGGEVAELLIGPLPEHDIAEIPRPRALLDPGIADLQPLDV